MKKNKQISFKIETKILATSVQKILNFIGHKIDLGLSFGQLSGWMIWKLLGETIFFEGLQIWDGGSWMLQMASLTWCV